MWKKSEAELSPPTAPRRATSSRPESSPSRKARIGAGLRLKGELSGEEDVIIEGAVEGKITLEGHGVIVEESGRVDAEITASSICVAGEVRGNLYGSEQVVLLKTGRVEGNIYAKSVTLETGARFKGSVDMDTMEPVSPSVEASSSSSSSESPTKSNGAASPRIVAS